MQLRQHDLGALLMKCLALMPNHAVNTDVVIGTAMSRTTSVVVSLWMLV
jgi:hypothetical protein